MKYRPCTPGYDITELVFNDMVQLRVLCTDLRRAELTAAKEADRVKAAARAPPEAPAQHAPHGGNRRTSGADDLRSQSKDILSARPEDPKPNEAEGTESMAEDDEQAANALLREGLEQAIHRKEVAIEAYPTYVPDTDTGEDEQAVAKMAHRVATANHVIATEKTWAVEKRKLYKDHCEALKSVEEWRVSLRPMNERER